MRRSKTVENAIAQKHRETRPKSFLLTCIGLVLLLATVGSQPLHAVPVGRYLYVLDNGAVPPQVEGFSITMTTGVLVSLGACADLPFAAASIPTSERVDVTGSYLYVADAGAPSQIWGFAINPANGCLAPIPGSPWATAGNGPEDMHITDGNFLYVTDIVAGPNPANVEGFQVGLGGVLAPIAGTPLAYGANPNGGLAYDSAGPFLFAGDDSGPAGPITPFYTAVPGGTPIPAPGCPGPCATVTPNPIDISTSAAGQCLLVLSAGGVTLDSYAVNPTTGALGWVNTLKLAADMHYLYADPFGRYAFVTSTAGDSIQAYTTTPLCAVAANGAAIKFAKGSAPSRLIVDPWGHFVYIALPGVNKIAGYTITANTGKLAAMAGQPWPTFVAGGGPLHIHGITP